MKKIFSFPQAQSLVLCGDIHGDIATLLDKLCKQYVIHDALVIVAGDCGIGFDYEQAEDYDRIYQHLSRNLEANNLWIVMMRGNHDNPAYYNGDKRIVYERWRTVPDYTVLQACGHTVLCVGGAVSIDRQMRLQMMAIDSSLERYWEDEAPVYDAGAMDALKGMSVDIVVTHTAPSFCELQTKRGLTQWCMRDAALWEDVTRERQTMDDIHAHLLRDGHPLKHWYYGHFHQSWNGYVDGVQFTLLDIMEVKELI